ncbi:cis-prenyltransferase [Vanrija albida]|uniref:Alkyl transferase n=1 Tax=Vanrija albida TaxID=181172 RepID=A0ABR3QDP6_9TREE
MSKPAQLKPAPGPARRDARRAFYTAIRPISLLLHQVHALMTTFLLAVIALGPMPRHVGFVMDGNRRYARSHGQRVAKGHQRGSESLKRTLTICLRLRIPVISVYAFAIDNFNRSQEEIDALMDLVWVELKELSREGGFLDRHGVRLRCIGRLDLLKPEMEAALREMEADTAGNKRGVLNVCGPYASRDEMTAAVRDTVAAVAEGGQSPDKITSQTVFSKLQTVASAASVDNGHGPLDIFIRTSGVKRLSDFMMWQADEDTQIHFVKTYWPDFGLTDLLPILLGWQQKVWLGRGRGV